VRQLSGFGGAVAAGRTLRPAVGLAGAAGFGGLLVDSGYISRQDLEAAERHAMASGVHLVDAVVTLGQVAEADSYRVLAQAAGREFTLLDDVLPSELAVRLVPERFARRYCVVPLRVDNRTMTYATCQPFQPEAESDIAFASGRRVIAWVATRSSVIGALDHAYPKVDELDLLADRLRGEREPIHVPVDEAPTESTVIALCNEIIGRAVTEGASDIHIECSRTSAAVRYRINGVLESILTLTGGASQPIRNRLKIMARADIAVRNRPQDGAFRVSVNDRTVDIRLSTLPTVDGEKIVLRVIDSQSPLRNLERLGYDQGTIDRLRRSLARPDGLVLVTGPTGSGKTTALYAALGHLQTGRTNIVSVEDPVERTLPGVTQIPVNAKAGNSFPAVLRSLLRQDPNVIMVGEVRDAEVAQIVGQAAYTGHLVLTSMHTVDTATAVIRLMNLGLEPFKIAESLVAVLAQRLVRRLCPNCRRRGDGLDAKDGSLPVPAEGFLQGPGCEHCRNTGYEGRVPVAELLTPSEELRSVIARGATAHELRGGMRAAGFPSMRDQAMRLVEAGITSVEEVDRVVSPVDEAEPVEGEGSRVLVADDDSITRMLVKLLLEREGYEVLEAVNGAQAIEIAGRERPALTLMDLHMPTLDGYEAITRLRTQATTATMPIVVLTAEEGPGVEQRVLELGADDYVLKPFDPDVLISHVNAVFRRLRLVA
jgi:type IV pilus assembly protein PilB